MSRLEGKGSRESAPLDAEALSIELLQALRGRRSKPGFAKMLGYKSNIAQRWEAGVRWPTAEKFFLIAARCGVKLAPIVETFLGRKSEKLTENEHSSRAGVAQLLTELKETTPIQLAPATPIQRFPLV